MGTAVGRHLLAAGTPLAVYDPAAGACDPLVADGAVGCSSPEDVASRSDLVLVIVVDDQQTVEAVTRCLDTARAGSVIAICASVRPETCRQLAERAARTGVTVIDAALVRGERGAEAGELVLFCGGPAEVIDELRRASAPFTEAVLRVGDVGAGQVAKTANNILLWACIRADFEVLRLGRGLGVEPSVLRDALEQGSGANRPLSEWGHHRLRWPHKDLEVALAVAEEAGVEVPLVEELARLMADLRAEDLRQLL